MSRLWSTARKHSYLAATAVAVCGFIGYLAYEVYQETTTSEEEQEQPPSPPNDDDTVEDVINIADELARSQDHYSWSNNSTRNIPSSLSPGQIRTPMLLSISARGIIFSSKETHDRWSSKSLYLNPQAVEILWRLSSLYNLYMVVVVRDQEDQAKIMEFLETHQIVNSVPSVTDSMVWVDHQSDYADSRTSSISAPSSDISAILASSVTDAPMLTPPRNTPLSREQVLFCQTEEGKAHLVRHLLTMQGSTKFTQNTGYKGYVGHVDTNRDVVARLAPVLKKIVHVDGDIDCGDAPGTNTAFSTGSSSTNNGGASTPAALSMATVERAKDITKSSIY
ncbi:hypothetical protein H4R99_002584 [Coemansia sp. RSA 1722]|nr:hypothetical protein IWW45_002715 [Coemansia sp. RSA 485]KAJ2602754.1 hypothetical protein H4R99_002584 [Coemansia sp. RSA 1722]